jgi:hypothetical protein
MGGSVPNVIVLEFQLTHASSATVKITVINQEGGALRRSAHRELPVHRLESAVPSGRACFVRQTRHCVPGYYQPSLRDVCNDYQSLRTVTPLASHSPSAVLLVTLSVGLSPNRAGRYISTTLVGGTVASPAKRTRLR